MDSLNNIIVKVADTNEREQIYKLRHDIYATELGQHEENDLNILKDALDDYNTYIVAIINDEIAGFVSITPPGKKYSIDKYIDRDEFPHIYSNTMYEGRLFTVLKPFRGTRIAFVLFFAVLRWVEAHGGRSITAIGRTDILDFYLKAGLNNLNRIIKSGNVEFALLHADIGSIRKKIGVYEKMLVKAASNVTWNFNFPLVKNEPCVHGGDFFDAIGPSFDELHKKSSIINADVLDAWFPPSPLIVDALHTHLPWIMRTSPPTHSQGLIDKIARYRNIPRDCILPGAGSSSLMYMAFPHLVKSADKALIIEPAYGEYAHILENVIECKVDRFYLSREDNYRIDTDELEKVVGKGYDLIILINPNNPTGVYLDNEVLKTVLAKVPARTKVWIDETYIEYAGPDQSLESFAAESSNIIICKSMSKTYALSGLRVGYLCGSRHIIDGFKRFSPPWGVSLPAQISAVIALQDYEYYHEQYRLTHEYREEMLRALAATDKLEIFPGMLNFLLCRIKPGCPDAAAVVETCKERNVFIRNMFDMDRDDEHRMIRIAVKNRETNELIVSTVSDALNY